MKKKPKKAYVSLLYTMVYTVLALVLMYGLVNIFSIDVHVDDSKLSAIETLDPNDKDEALLIEQGLALREWSEQLKRKLYIYRVAGIVIELLLVVDVVLNTKEFKKAIEHKEEEQLPDNKENA